MFELWLWQCNIHTREQIGKKFGEWAISNIDAPHWFEFFFKKTTESTVPLPSQKIRPTIRRNYIKIGRPGYKITKIREPETHQLGLLIQISYPEVSEGLRPYHRFMSAYEQRMEAPNKQIQYLLVHAEPYEVIAFKIQSVPIDREDREGVEGDFGRGFWTHWDKDAKMYTLQLLFKIDPVEFMRKQLVAGGRGSMSRSFAPLPIPLPLPLPAPIQLAPPHPLILRPPPPL